MKFLSLTNILFLSTAQLALTKPISLYSFDFQNPLGLLNFPPADKPIPGDSPIRLCDLSSPKLVDIYKLNLTPNPPVKGQNLTIYAEGFVEKTIVDGAYVDVDVKYGYLRLLRQEYDLCEESGNAGVECPIKEGKLVVNTSVAIPAQFPAGKYSITGRAYTKEGSLLTCLSTTIELL